MAEGVFRDLTNFGTPNQHPLISHIDSCGTGAYHEGAYSDSRTMSVLKDNHITSYKHQARKVRVPNDFTEFDYILAMDEENVADLHDMVKRAAKRGLVKQSEALARVHLFGEYGGKVIDEEVGDPYYGAGRDGFEVAFEQVSRFGKSLLKHVEQQAAQELGRTAS
ncbi:hypothetical protein LTR08_004102 [Meristemomyces frigidus]|nr:hypothetical protein LTR08_004102 [Meristemomyces frigidus]